MPLVELVKSFVTGPLMLNCLAIRSRLTSVPDKPPGPIVIAPRSVDSTTLRCMTPGAIAMSLKLT
ncbi:hypothetical protein WT05_15465 [Burkholderia stagnalis]|nr:hypothetical protein WT05_15465 [Burkholderia stagnalis]